MARRTMLFLGSFLMLPLCATAADWTLRFEAGATNDPKDSRSAYSLGSSELTLDSGYLLAVGCEYRLNPLVGFEVSLSRMALDAEWREFEIVGVGDPPQPESVLVASDSGEVALQPIGLTAMFHVLRTSRSDVYIGPQVAWVTYDIALKGAPDRESEAAFGVKIRWDWRPEDSPWSVGLSYRYLEAQRDDLERDVYTNLPIQAVALGVAYRFGNVHASQ